MFKPNHTTAAGHPVHLHLAGNVPVAFRGARGATLECIAGRLWVTITGQPGDFLLEPGARLCIESNGLGLVEGMPEGVMRVVGAVAEARPAMPAQVVPMAR